MFVIVTQVKQGVYAGHEKISKQPVLFQLDKHSIQQAVSLQLVGLVTMFSISLQFYCRV